MIKVTGILIGTIFPCGLKSYDCVSKFSTHDGSSTHWDIFVKSDKGKASNATVTFQRDYYFSIVYQKIGDPCPDFLVSGP